MGSTDDGTPHGLPPITPVTVIAERILRESMVGYADRVRRDRDALRAHHRRYGVPHRLSDDLYVADAIAGGAVTHTERCSQCRGAGTTSIPDPGLSVMGERRYRKVRCENCDGTGRMTFRDVDVPFTAADFETGGPDEPNSDPVF